MFLDRDEILVFRDGSYDDVTDFFWDIVRS
jgi:hypothetical protein